MRILLLRTTRYLLIFTAVFAIIMSASYCLAQDYPPPGNPQENSYSEEEQPANEYYSTYSDQAMAFYRSGESTKAIDMMLKAFKLAPENPAVINNLAACYIQRGVYFQNNRKDYGKAAEDYRQSLFYLVHEWPSDVTRSGINEQNIEIVENNLEGTLKSLNAPIGDWKWHLKTAWELRRQGKLQDAMVEYAWVTKLSPKNSEAWTAMGDIYTVRQKPDKALTAYQKAIDSSSAASDTLFVKLGTSLLQSGTPEKAVEAFNKALALKAGNKDALLALEQIWKKEIVLNPRNMPAHLNLGAVYQQLQRYDEAYAQYQVADRLSPNNPLIQMNLGSLYQAKGQFDDAGNLYDEILKRDPGNSQILLYKADILKQQGKSQEAEGMLQEALKSGQNKKQILEQLIAIHKNQGDSEKIKGDWKLYSKIFPGDASIQYQAGLALHELKDFEAAIGYYQAAVAINPNMSEAYANMGTAFYALNKNEEAATTLKKALQLNPSLDEVKELITAIDQKKSSAVILEAARLHEEGKYSEATRKYEEAIAQNPKNADIYARYGLALQALKRYPDAIAAYDKAIALEPGNAFYNYYKGSVYDEQDKLEEAKKLYEKALSIDPLLTQAKEALDALNAANMENKLVEAFEAYNRKNYAKSLQIIDKIVKDDPANATAYYYKGLVYDAQKKLDPARISYEKAIELDSKLADAVYALAVVLDSQGNRSDAKITYQKFIEMTKDQPEDDFIKYAKERVSSL